MDWYIYLNLWNTLASLFALLSRSDCGVNGLGRVVSPVLRYSEFCECLCLDHAEIQPVDQLATCVWVYINVIHFRSSRWGRKFVASSIDCRKSTQLESNYHSSKGRQNLGSILVNSVIWTGKAGVAAEQHSFSAKVDSRNLWAGIGWLNEELATFRSQISDQSAFPITVTINLMTHTPPTNPGTSLPNLGNASRWNVGKLSYLTIRIPPYP